MTPEEAFEFWGKKIYGFFRKRGFSLEDAQDGVQEVFKRALLTHVIHWNRAGPYLYKIAYHWAVDQWRKPRMLQMNEDDFAEKQPIKDDFLGILKQEERAYIILHYEDGFSFEEIAKMVSKPVGTIKSTVHRAKKKVRSEEVNE